MAALEKRNPAGKGGVRNVTGNAGGNSKVNNTDRKQTPQQKWRARNPLADWAHNCTRSAIRRGLLTRPDRCEECGSVGPVDAHHDPERYDQPLHIQAWICRKCHKAAHRKAGAA
ncbi:MAG: hypothetical protein MEQ84_08510 [Mesorhizobium sp.]|nr:hypothetical protein [Mesorhizobium sp.]